MFYWEVDFEPDAELIAKETIEEVTYGEEEFQESEESSLP